LWIQAALGTASMILLWGLIPYFVKTLDISPAFAQLAHDTFFFVALSIPIALISIQLRGALEGARCFGLVNSVQIPHNSALFLVPLFGVLIGVTLPTIIALLFITRLLTMFIYLILCLKIFPELRSWPLPKRKKVKSLLKYGGWVMGTNIASLILLQIDRFLIGSLGTLSDVTFYTLPYEMATRLFVIPGAIMTVVFPTVSTIDAMGTSDRLEFLFHRSFKYIFLFMGLLVATLAILGDTIMTIWVGETIALKSTAVFQILVLGALIISLAYIPLSFLQAMGKSALTAKIRIWQIPPTILLITLAIIYGGIIEVAYVWLARAVFDALLYFYIFYKLNKISSHGLILASVHKIALLIILFSGLIASVHFHIQSPMIQILLFCALTILLLFSIYRYILDEQEKNNIFQFIKFRLFLQREQKK